MDDQRRGLDPTPDANRDPLTGESVRLAGPPSGRPLGDLADAAEWPLEIE